CKVISDGSNVGVDLAASKNVGDVDFLDVAEADAATKDLTERGKQEELHASTLDNVGDLGDHPFARRRDGENDSRDVAFLGALDNVIPATEDLPTEEVEMSLLRVVVYETHHAVG